MAKHEDLEQQMRAEEQERPENGDEQLEHPCRLRTSAVQTTKRKSLYNQEYGVFARDRWCDKCDGLTLQGIVICSLELRAMFVPIAKVGSHRHQCTEVIEVPKVVVFDRHFVVR